MLWHIGSSTFTLQSDTGSEVGSLPLISSVDGLGKLQSVVGMTFQNAFELLGRAKPIQNLLKAVVTDVKMWNAFLNNKAVQEFLRQLETELQPCDRAAALALLLQLLVLLILADLAALAVVAAAAAAALVLVSLV
ncbi:hypothetical protein TEA_012855 [Camellia sinensis var. sinensis]|uniref:Uncharacterized protein n=1 Tax=Camellia sinensis var. sinensis TaxID=542762 RepID=A0A4S4EKC2_CAMSN|nr:hypothetical protein TEA_012855 [Camellia sinensis var. sinensis]